MRAVELAFGQVGRRCRHGAPNVLQRQPQPGQPRSVDLQTHRAGLAPLDGHGADPGDLRQFLHDRRRRHVVDLVQRHRVGGQRQDQHGYVGGVDLLIGRGTRQQCDRDPARGGVDSRLDVLRSGVDVARQIELQRDLAGAGSADRVHHRQPGNLPEIVLERRRDRGFDDIGRGAGIARHHLDRRKIDVGQRRHRQDPVTEQPEGDDRDNQQGRRNWTQDERGRHGRSRPGLSRNSPVSARPRAG